MNLHNLEKHMMAVDAPLDKERLARIKAHIGVALSKEHIICDPLIDRLGSIAVGVWNAATEEASPKLKPLEWHDGNGGEPPTEENINYYWTAVGTKFGLCYVNHYEGEWKLRVDGIFIDRYNSLEEAKEGAWEWYQCQVATLYL